MADNIEHLMLEQFRRLDAKVDTMLDMIREMNVEMHAFRHHIRGNELDIDAHRNAIARLQSRVDRIERRLDLSESDPTSPTGLSEDGAPYQPPPRRR